MPRPSSSDHAPGRRPLLSGALLAVLVVGGLGACGTEDDGGGSASAPASSAPASTAATVDAALLEGSTFTSTSVEGHELVADTAVEIGFEDETMSVSAGCNTHFGAYTLEGDVLAWADEPAATMLACPDDLAAQDAWLRDLFGAGVTATSRDGALELTSGDVTLAMAASPGADLETLLGRTWSVVGTISDGSTSRLPARTRTPRLVVGDDGLSRLDTGCNTGRTRVRVDAASITFAPPTVTRVACPEPDSVVEDIVLSVVDGRTDYVRYDGSVLIITKDGAGLVLGVR